VGSPHKHRAGSNPAAAGLDGGGAKRLFVPEAGHARRLAAAIDFLRLLEHAKARDVVEQIPRAVR